MFRNRATRRHRATHRVPLRQENGWYMDAGAIHELPLQVMVQR